MSMIAIRSALCKREAPAKRSIAEKARADAWVRRQADKRLWKAPGNTKSELVAALSPKKRKKPQAACGLEISQSEDQEERRRNRSIQRPKPPTRARTPTLGSGTATTEMPLIRKSSV